MTSCLHRLAKGVDETQYFFACWTCGNKGEVSVRSDDFSRFNAQWQGFSGTAFAAGPRQDTLQCEACKGMNVSLYRQATTSQPRRNELYSFVMRGDGKIEVRHQSSSRRSARNA
jgi:hypothetical protein